MAPLTFDFTLIQGESASILLTCQDAEGAIVPLTGATGLMQARATYEALSPVLEISTANARMVIDGPAGTVRLDVSAAVTEALPAGAWPYDLFVEWPDDTRTCLAVGQVTVQPANTRWPA